MTREGSGKTLVGMLIGDYLRSEKEYKVLYLCPTNQLVYQIVSLTNDDYGISSTAFVGPKKDYKLEDKNDYEFSSSIAVSSYSSFFNSNPYFFDPDIIIFDDAHAAGDLVSNNWSVRIFRHEHKELYDNLIELSKEFISEDIYNLCVEDNAISIKDVDKIPNISFLNIENIFKATVEDYLYRNKKDNNQNDFSFAWYQIKNNLTSCNTFITPDHILIKPFISPTNIFKPFMNAKQRIYMSATTGKSGELERAFGVQQLTKIYDEKFQALTMGRKFFLFPTLIFSGEEIGIFIEKIVDYVPRSLIMVKDNKMEKAWTKYFQDKDKKTYNGQDLESRKDEFVKEEDAVAVISNRTDGINFPNDECRLLILTDLQENTDAQEFFMSHRMGSSILFSELMKIKMMQSVGRCTREYTDYTLVCILGEKFSRYFLESKNINSFIPELHAELNFAKQQFLGSQNKSMAEILEMVRIFLYEREKWDEPERYIQNDAKKISENKSLSGNINKILEETAKHEVAYHNYLWIENYEDSILEANIITELLSKDEQLRGYLSFWNYLSAYTYYCLNNMTQAEIKLKEASKMSLSIKWFNHLIKDNIDEDSEEIINIISNIENKIIDELIVKNKSDILREIDRVGELITLGGTEFEEGLKNLGSWLGYQTYNYGDTGSPDPIWVLDPNTCIVTESKIYTNEPKIVLKHIRETSTHKKYIENNKSKFEIFSDCDIIVVFISNADTFKDEDTKKLSPDIYYVNQNRIIDWSKQIIIILKEIVKAFDGSKSYLWQEYTFKILKDNKLTAKNVKNFFMKEKIKDLDF